MAFLRETKTYLLLNSLSELHKESYYESPVFNRELNSGKKERLEMEISLILPSFVQCSQNDAMEIFI